MKLLLILILFVFNIINAEASYPTPEGLFRNGNNQEVTANKIIIKFLVEQIEDKKVSENVPKEDNTEQKKEVVSEIKKTDLTIKQEYIKWVFSLNNSGDINLLQLMYEKLDMKNSSIKNVNYINNFFEKIKSENFTERSLFYSIMSTLILNESRGIMHFFEKHVGKFPSNKAIMNREKIQLLKKYKKYLLAIKGDKEIEKTIKSPIKSEQIEIQEKINKIRKSSMYNNLKYVTLSRTDNTIMWRMQMGNFDAYFSNEKHEFNKLLFQSEKGPIEVFFGNYILFNGIHQLPKLIVLKESSGKTFRIRMLDLRHYNLKKKYYIKEETKKYERILGARRKNNPDLYDIISFNKFFFVQ